MPDEPLLIPTEFSEAERAACVKVLRALAAAPERLLDKETSEFALLAEVRAEANRLIEAVKQQVRIGRGQPPDGVKRTQPASAKPASHRGKVTPNRSQEPAASNGVSRIQCYVCSQRTDRAHLQYAYLCMECGEFNLAKRRQTADLSSRRAIVTGGRVRIGYHTALKLLRAGAEVHATTRFPCDAARRYRREPDFAQWEGRLTLHGLDFRHAAAVIRFAEELASEPLDILINNAAQTLRRPPAYYRHLVAAEQRGELDEPSDSLVRRIAPRNYHRKESPTRLAPPYDRDGKTDPNATATAAALSQLVLLPDDRRHCENLFPRSHDALLEEPLDLRPVTSWTQAVDEVHPIELLEAHLVNAFAPFLLLNRLLPALRRSSQARRFVVNVSAREGRFSVRKGPGHPHTNMAKAALNMLTRTVAGDLAREGIFVNSVDPGWVSHQQPFDPEQVEDSVASPPLAAEDGAARVLALIFEGVRETDPPPHGRLFKNFCAVEW